MISSIIEQISNIWSRFRNMSSCLKISAQFTWFHQRLPLRPLAASLQSPRICCLRSDRSWRWSPWKEGCSPLQRRMPRHIEPICWSPSPICFQPKRSQCWSWPVAEAPSPRSWLAQMCLPWLCRRRLSQPGHLGSKLVPQYKPVECCSQQEEFQCWSLVDETDNWPESGQIPSCVIWPFDDVHRFPPWEDVGVPSREN